MLTPEKLDPKVVNLLNARLNDEYTAHYFYRNASDWCANTGFLKAATYFEGEANSELEHAKGIEKYMTDWNVNPSLAPVGSPKAISGLAALIEAAYEIEYDLYEQYEDNSVEIFKMNDLCTFDFLSKYRTIQRESVAEYATFINRLNLINSADKFQLFVFENESF